MAERYILITGAYSGIGKAFVRAYLSDPSNVVFALDNAFAKFPGGPDWFESSGSSNTSTSERLSAIRAYTLDVGRASGRNLLMSLHTWSIDITDEEQLEELSGKLPPTIDLVIHCAGVRGLESSVPVTRGSHVALAETLNATTALNIIQTFNTNTVGSFELLRTVLPSLRSGRGKAIIMGSRMGSIGHNSTGGGYAYRASKAALNAVVKSLSIDVPQVTFAIVHPGRVESNLVGQGVKEDGAITAEESVKDMLLLIENLRKEDSGKFMDRFGRIIVW